MVVRGISERQGKRIDIRDKDAYGDRRRKKDTSMLKNNHLINIQFPIFEILSKLPPIPPVHLLALYDDEEEEGRRRRRRRRRRGCLMLSSVLCLINGLFLITTTTTS